MGCCGDLWRVQQASQFYTLLGYKLMGVPEKSRTPQRSWLIYFSLARCCFRPRRWVYIQTALKIFGSWTVDLANRWSNDFLADIKQTIDMVVSGLQSLGANEDIEVQERVSTLIILHSLNFNQTQAPNSPKPEPSTPIYDVDDGLQIPPPHPRNLNSLRVYA